MVGAVLVVGSGRTETPAAEVFLLAPALRERIDVEEAAPPCPVVEAPLLDAPAARRGGGGGALLPVLLAAALPDAELLDANDAVCLGGEE